MAEILEPSPEMLSQWQAEVDAEIARQIQHLKSAFEKRGIFLNLHDPKDAEHFICFHKIALDIVNGFEPSVRFQETGSSVKGRSDTVDPVKRFHDAITNAWEALGEAVVRAELETSPDKVNVSSEFIQIIDNFETAEVNGITSLQHITLTFAGLLVAAEQALTTGTATRKGRPPRLVYHQFVDRLASVWAAKRNDPGYRVDGDSYSGPFIDLVEDCQSLLPAELQAPTTSEVANRVATAAPALRSQQKIQTRL